MNRLIAIGDIHGCIDELKNLIDQIHPEDSDRLVFLGDYVDRGPDSKAVIEYLVQLKKKYSRTVFLRGNHEDMFLHYLGISGKNGGYYKQNGGVKTLESYGVGETPGLSCEERRKYIFDRISESHIEFLKSLVHYHFEDQFLFVHAGINPLKTWEEQTEQELIWVRTEFYNYINDNRFHKIIVHGHTPAYHVYFDLPNRICVDTGCYSGGYLSAISLDRNDVINSQIYTVKALREYY